MFKSAYYNMKVPANSSIDAITYIYINKLSIRPGWPTNNTKKLAPETKTNIKKGNKIHNQRFFLIYFHSLFYVKFSFRANFFVLFVGQLPNALIY